MYFFGSDSNLPLQSSQQKPISCFSYSTVFVGLTSLPVNGQVLLIGSSHETAAAALPANTTESTTSDTAVTKVFIRSSYYLKVHLPLCASWHALQFDAALSLSRAP